MAAHLLAQRLYAARFRPHRQHRRIASPGSDIAVAAFYMNLTGGPATAGLPPGSNRAGIRQSSKPRLASRSHSIRWISHRIVCDKMHNG